MTEHEKTAGMANYEEQIKNVFCDFFEMVEAQPEKSPTETEMLKFGKEYQSKLNNIMELFAEDRGRIMAENILKFLLEEKTRGVWKAIRYKREDLSRVTMTETTGRYNDTLTLELERKLRKINCFANFCEYLGLDVSSLEDKIQNMQANIHNILKIRHIYKGLFAGTFSWRFRVTPPVEVGEVLKGLFDSAIYGYLSEVYRADFARQSERMDLNSDVFFTHYLSYYRVFKHFNMSLERLSSADESNEAMRVDAETGLNGLHFAMFLTCELFLEQMAELLEQMDLSEKHIDMKDLVYAKANFILKELEVLFNFAKGFLKLVEGGHNPNIREVLGEFIEKFLEFKIILAEFTKLSLDEEDSDTEKRLELYRHLGMCCGAHEAFEKALDLKDKNCLFPLFITCEIDFDLLEGTCQEDEDLRIIFVRSAKAKIRDPNSSFKIRKKCLKILKIDTQKKFLETNTPISQIWKAFNSMQNVCARDPNEADLEEASGVFMSRMVSLDVKRIDANLRWVEATMDFRMCKIVSDLEKLLMIVLDRSGIFDWDKLLFSVQIVNALLHLEEFKMGAKEIQNQIMSRFFKFCRNYEENMKRNGNRMVGIAEHRSGIIQNVLEELNLKDQFETYQNYQ